MKRFRFTLLAVCLVLLYLGWNDASLYLRNRAPLAVTIGALEKGDTPREWLRISGGTLIMDEAISTSGSIELDALLVPLKADPATPGFRVLVETRDPALLDFFQTYHFKLDSALAKERFHAEHQQEFRVQRDIIGTQITGMIASGNRDKLTTLAKDLGIQVSDNVMLLSEGNQPPTYRGFLFLAIGILGLGKLLLRWPKNESPEAVSDN
ncbi:hypothetical protein [Trichloromonas sp.]|uniref:hypothetical protein n=1 Tax=Trichloromonas sp. TaxID=3069249 RepID=UPI003D81B36F